MSGPSFYSRIQLYPLLILQLTQPPERSASSHCSESACKPSPQSDSILTQSYPSG